MTDAAESSEAPNLALLLNDLEIGSTNDNNNTSTYNNNINNNENNRSRSSSQNIPPPRKYVAPGSGATFTMHPSLRSVSVSGSGSGSGSGTGSNKLMDSLSQRAQAGHRLMILMRGPSGCGKSTMAENLMRKTRLLERYDAGEFVLSTDDYFKSRRGEYVFNPTLLPAAHDWNKERVRDKALRGWSPIIVDNTNTMVWEMMPYVQIAVKQGYVLELLEPQNAWRQSASKLAQMTKHQVPRESIQRMLERFEKVTAADLLRLLKETKYSVSLPQLRLCPPLPAVPSVTPTAPPVASAALTAAPAAQDEQAPPETAIPTPKFKLNANAESWVPFEQNAASFWSQEADEAPIAAPARSPEGETREKLLIDLLRESSATGGQETPAAKTENKEASGLRRHCLDCPNEPDGFAQLRQMYPNKQLTGLWDLFVNCQADVGWAVDILLKEDELNDPTGSNSSGEDLLNPEETAEFQCDCDGSFGPSTLPTEQPLAYPNPGKAASKGQRQQRNKRNAVATKTQLQAQIENCFVLGDDKYSDHMRKIRAIRNGCLDQPVLPQPDEPDPEPEPEPEEEESEDNSLLEIELDAGFVSQLRKHFPAEDEMLPAQEDLPATTRVFLPRQMANQLYMIWREGLYNQLEEQRQKTLRDDEQFARLLKHPNYADCSESPSNVGELLDMELAWSIYNSEQLAAKEAAELAARQKPPNDIATHLTKMKLCEKFPEIPKETLLEIYAASGSDYVQTVKVLDSNVKSAMTEAELFEKAVHESEKLSSQVTQEKQKEEQQLQGSSNQVQRSSSVSSANKSPHLLEEAKCAALRDFEETRNLAAHHAQLKAECYLKARQAAQRGNGNVALYYSEIAKLHKQKIDGFNHRAANCIMEVHRHTQNNPDLLDLHYLHAVEAISCLDLFIDRHITGLRNSTRVYKQVFIITGRGLHSANGVSTIKNRVRARLGERRLRWQEVNPGLLRVKVFSASRHSKNF